MRCCELISKIYKDYGKWVGVRVGQKIKKLLQYIMPGLWCHLKMKRELVIANQNRSKCVPGLLFLGVEWY